jgi:hypothetical protein
VYYAAYLARVEREQKTADVQILRMEKLEFGFVFVFVGKHLDQSMSGNKYEMAF